jgi:hypothetical protein
MALSSCDASVGGHHYPNMEVNSTPSRLFSPPKTECHPMLRTYCSNPVVLRLISRGKQS